MSVYKPHFRHVTDIFLFSIILAIVTHYCYYRQIVDKAVIYLCCTILAIETLVLVSGKDFLGYFSTHFKLHVLRDDMAHRTWMRMLICEVNQTYCLNPWPKKRSNQYQEEGVHINEEVFQM